MTPPRSRPLWLRAPTRFAALTQGQARGALALVAVWLLATLTALAVPGQPVRETATPAHADGDIALYDGVIESVRHGGGYYPTTAEALRQGGYPLRPFVTFRLPTLTVALAELPRSWRAVPLYLLTLAVLLAWAARLRAALASRAALVVGVAALLAGALTGTQGGLASFHDIWAGLFIALSLALRRRGRWLEAVAVALCAMLVRELAAPYAVAMAAMAWRDGERREAAGWLAALAVFAAVLASHAHAVGGVLHPGDPASAGWAGMLGLGFAVRSVALSTGLLPVPLAIAAPLVGLSVVGLAGWRDSVGARTCVTLAMYAVLIAAAARADNFYWALLIAPLSLVGLAFVPDAARDLLRAAFDRRRITVTRLAR